MNEKKKKEKQMKLPRFSYQVPEDLTTDFLEEMKEEFRETPGDCLTAILRKHFRRKTEIRMLKAFTESPEAAPIPQYGPKQPTSNVDQEQSRSSGEE